MSDDPGPQVSVPIDESPAPLEGETQSDEVPYQVMHFESVLYDLTDPSPMVHLVEAASPYRFVVIPIALADGIALQHAYGEIESRRPGTHELMTTMLTRLQVEVIAARIVRIEGGVYFAELDLMTPKGREVFDCRASDALSMALRQSVQAPILCSEDVLQAYLS
ncbi:MAG TPA: bifunctional nuclease family protein [Acidimicrobiales bacterium]|nr:bifunctional nuclease family protein [Acidimicrobiales bacterium]